MSNPPGLIDSAPLDPEGLGQFGMKPLVGPEFGDVIGKVGGRWPAIQPHLNTFVVKQGDQRNNIGGGGLEFYPPWEAHNPHPGRSTIEIFDPALKGKQLEDAVAGDMLHLLGAKDPRTEQPVDPRFYEMKQRLLSTLTPEQLAVDRRTFDQEKARMPSDERTFQEWMETSRGDAYIRGYITPDANDEWRKQGVYTPQQAILEEMRGYLEKVTP